MKKFIPLLFILVIAGCNKDTNKTHELIAKKWKMTARTILTPLTGTALEGYSTDWYSPGGCSSDMIWVYNKDETFLYENAGSCVSGTSNSVDKKVGMWSLANNNTTLKISYTISPGSNFEFRIIELTPTRMVVQRLERTGVAGANVDDYQEMDLMNQYIFLAE